MTRAIAKVDASHSQLGVNSSASSGRIQLVTVVSIAALVELLFNRVAFHLIIGSGIRPSWWSQFSVATQFIESFVGVLSFIVLGAACLVLLRDRHLFLRIGRVGVVIGGLAFLPLAGLALVSHVPPTLSAALVGSFALFVVMLLAGFLVRRASLRHKLGAVYLACPILLASYWAVCKQFPQFAPQGAGADLPARIRDIGEYLVVFGAFATSVFFLPIGSLPQLFSPFPMATAMISTGLLGLFTTRFHADAVRVATYALNLHLPAGSNASVEFALYMLAFFVFVITVATMLIYDAHSRQIAIGLFLIAVSGFQLQWSYQYLLSGLGLVQLIRGCMARSGMPEYAQRLPTSEQWKRFFERLRQHLGATTEGDPVVLRHERAQIARVRARKEGLDFVVRIHFEPRQALDLEIDIGQPPKDHAPAGLVRKVGLRGLPARLPRGNKVESIDPAFVTYDDSEGTVVAALHESKMQLLDSMHGSLSIWPAEGLQYVARPLSDGWPVPLVQIANGSETDSPDDASVDDLAALVDVLLDIGRRLDIH